MQAQFKYTEYISNSGNTQIYIFRKQKKKRKNITSVCRSCLKRQRLLGIALIAISVVGCAVMPEDCGGYLLAGLMGIARVVCN